MARPKKIKEQASEISEIPKETEPKITKSKKTTPKKAKPKPKATPTPKAKASNSTQRDDLKGNLERMLEMAMERADFDTCKKILDMMSGSNQIPQNAQNSQNIQSVPRQNDLDEYRPRINTPFNFRNEFKDNGKDCRAEKIADSKFFKDYEPDITQRPSKEVKNVRCASCGETPPYRVYADNLTKDRDDRLVFICNECVKPK